MVLIRSSSCDFSSSSCHFRSPRASARLHNAQVAVPNQPQLPTRLVGNQNPKISFDLLDRESHAHGMA